MNCWIGQGSRIPARQQRAEAGTICSAHGIPMTQSSLIHSGISIDDFFRSYAGRGEPLVLATVVANPGIDLSQGRRTDAHRGRWPSGGPAERRLPRGGFDGTRPWRVAVRPGRDGSLRHAQLRRRDLGYRPGLRRRDDHPAQPAGSRQRLPAVRLRRAMPLRPGRCEVRAGHRVAQPTLSAGCSVLAAQQTTRAATGSDNRDECFDAARREHSGRSRSSADDATFLVVPIELPPRLLLFGAGPDAMPLVEFAGLMNWQVTVLDHRPAYAVPNAFLAPGAWR